MAITAHTDEKDLLLRLQGGDHAAFEKLYHRYSRPLLAKLDRKVSEEYHADDILQDLFIKIWERRGQIDPEQPFGGYLYRIAQRMVTDHYRKQARNTVFYKQVRQDSSETANYTDEELDGRETKKILEQAISLLPAQQQRAFSLCKIEGKSYKEAAALMSISPETVHAHLVKATQSVKAYLHSVQQHIPGALAVALILSEQILY